MSRFALWRHSTVDGAPASGWRYFAKLTSSYFVSNQWPVAWGMLLTLIAQKFVATYVTVLSARWEGALFDAIGARAADRMLPLVLQFAGITVATVLYGLVQGYMQPMLSMRWRAWLTADYQERWLRDDRYLTIERNDTPDNPDQRMTEDLTLFTQQFLFMFLNLLGALSGIWMFGGLLLEASDPIRFAIAGYVFAIPGDMVVYAILYAIFGSWLTAKIGRPLIRLNQRQQHLEANYRFRLINVRRNAEQISFARAVASEWRALIGDFTALFVNFRRTQIVNSIIGFFAGIYSSISTVLPIFLVLPKYFAGRVTIGEIMQTRQGFGAFVMSLSWFIQSYQTIALIAATVNRLRALDDALLEPAPSGIAVDRAAPQIAVSDLSLARPDGSALARIGDWQVERGERWVITGHSGAGKSTLLRALAGIWPYGTGAVALPADGTMMFLPQRGYVPIGTIKEALAFPAQPEAFDDDECSQLLQRFGLNHWVPSIHESALWSERLSPGEQQRLALARVVLQRPDYLFLDEATSALDGDNAAHAFSTLIDALPGLTLVSVVHDPALECFHHRKLCLDQGHAVTTALHQRG